METEQRTEKQAPCEIIPASQTFRPKYDLKKHSKIDGRKNKIRKKAETKKAFLGPVTSNAKLPLTEMDLSLQQMNEAALGFQNVFRYSTYYVQTTKDCCGLLLRARLPHLEFDQEI